MKKQHIRKAVGFFSALWLVILGCHSEGGASDFARPGPALFAGERAGMFLHFLERFVDLQLTPEQQEKILPVFKRHRNDFQEALKRLGDARKKLNDAIAQDNGTESAVREAHKSVASAQEDLAVLRARVRREVLSILTEEQKAKVLAWMEERGDGPFGAGFPMPKRPKP